MNIDQIRKRIDTIDAQLVELLNERTQLATTIGKIKRRAGEEIYSPEREEAVLKRVVACSRGPLGDLQLRAVWREIMSAALALEKNLVIAYVGPEGSPAHTAARNKFGESLRYKAEPSMEAVFTAVSKGRADYGVVPEHLRTGAVTHACELLVDSELKICAEIHQPTKHLVIGRKAAPRTGQDKTAVLFTLPDRIGALVQGLTAFQKHRISLVNIESHAIRGKPEAAYFFAEVRGHTEDSAVRKALADLERLSTFVKVLGSYADQRG